MKADGPKTATKILLFDIETSPHEGWAWRAYDTNLIKITKPGHILSFAWKWLGENEIRGMSLPMFPAYKRDHDNTKPLMMALHELMKEADVIVGHNIDRFDDRMINTDFIVNDIEPPPPHKTVDTLKVARSKFRFPSNKMGDLAERLKVPRKVKHEGFEMWEGCMAGNTKSWANMLVYNMGDIATLEGIYLKVRPWMTNHPNVNLLTNLVGCPRCASPKPTMRRGHWRMFASGKKIQFQCTACGGYCKGEEKEGAWRFW